MRFLLRALKWIALLVVVAALGGALWLYLYPPALIRVGSNYAAKIVCSNVFLGGREAQEVLRTDVQAPGHPLLELMQVQVYPQDATVRTGLYGVIGDGLAVYRGGTGCAVAPKGLASIPESVAPHSPASRNTLELWPDGLRIDVSQNQELARVLDDIKLTGPGMRAVVVVKDGRIIGERYGPGVVNFEQPLLGWSMTKTVTAALVGAAIGEGLLSVNDSSLLPEWSGDERSAIKVEHLLGMESGLEFNEDYGDVTDVTRMLYLEGDMAAYAAAKSLEAEPGERFSYSSGTSVLLSRILQNSFEDAQDALAFPRKALFDPLGMDSAVLETDLAGTFAGSSYLYANARDWARFGLLLADDGVWQGQRILPEGWVDYMRTPTEASGGEYGRHVWLHGPRGNLPPTADPDEGFDLPEDAFWLLGHDGQTMTIIPSQRLVILRMGLTPSKLGYRPQALVEAVVKAVRQTEE